MRIPRWSALLLGASIALAGAIAAIATGAPPLATTYPTDLIAPVVSPRLSRHLGDGSLPNGLGVNVHLDANMPPRFEQIHAAGFRLVRTDLLWDDTEKQPGIYEWWRTDELIERLRDAHLVPLLILAYSNALYAPPNPGHKGTPSFAYAAPHSGSARAAFMAFARAAAHRYGSQVIWEIWNEPDHNFGQPPNHKDYVDFAVEACRQIRSVAPNAAVIGPAASGFVWPLLHDFTAADRTGCFDAVSIHPYRDEPPESVLRDWASARSRVRQYGCTGCPTFVSSEWGYSSVAGVLSPDEQAQFVVRAYLLNVMAGIPVSIIYDWQDDGPLPTEKEANFGLLDISGKPKPAYHLIGQIANELTGLRYVGRIETEDNRDFVLAFGNDRNTRKLIGWSTSKPRSNADGRSPKLSLTPAVLSPYETMWSHNVADAAGTGMRNRNAPLQPTEHFK